MSATNTGWLQLSESSVIVASGTDARDFLHKQLTNDINGLTSNESRLAGYCSAQGRLYTVLRALQWGDDIALVTPQSTAVKLIARLRMFVLRSKVVLTDATANLSLFGVIGEAFAAQLATIIPLPDVANATSSAQGVVVTRMPDVTPRYLVIADGSMAHKINDLFAATPPLAADIWRLHDIAAGLPTIYAENSETFTPQMVNLDLIGGVSFTKGCYPGQEIVARTHYLGRVKRRMYSCRVAESNAPAPGAAIVAPGATDPNVGKIVDAVATPNGVFALAVIQSETLESGADLHLSDAAGPRIETCEPTQVN